ncbi:MAG: hypothetical protein H8E10_07575 [Desulfobacterales bacterium]|nr:hypothetical protein [Desulfobacterales bacterium]
MALMLLPNTASGANISAFVINGEKQNGYLVFRQDSAYTARLVILVKRVSDTDQEKFITDPNTAGLYLLKMRWHFEFPKA